MKDSPPSDRNVPGGDPEAELDQLRKENAELAAWRDRCAAAASDLAMIHQLLRGCATALVATHAPGPPVALQDLSDFLETAALLTEQIGRAVPGPAIAKPAPLDIVAECLQVSRAFERAFSVSVSVLPSETGGRLRLRGTDPLAFRRCLLDMLAHALRAGDRSTLVLRIDATGANSALVELAAETSRVVGLRSYPRAAARTFPTPLAASELADVRRFALAQGGRLDIKPGRLCLALPLDASSADAKAPRPGRAMVVDDHPAVRRSVLRALRRLGWDTIEAADARTALELCAESPPELIVTDIVMGGEMDGIELAQALRVAHPALAILVMSGHTPRRVPEDLEFVQKPIEESRLADALERALGRAALVGQGKGSDDQLP